MGQTANGSPNRLMPGAGTPTKPISGYGMAVPTGPMTPFTPGGTDQMATAGQGMTFPAFNNSGGLLGQPNTMFAGGNQNFSEANVQPAAGTPSAPPGMAYSTAASPTRQPPIQPPPGGWGSPGLPNNNVNPHAGQINYPGIPQSNQVTNPNYAGNQAHIGLQNWMGSHDMSQFPSPQSPNVGQAHNKMDNPTYAGQVASTAAGMAANQASPYGQLIQSFGDGPQGQQGLQNWGQQQVATMSQGQLSQQIQQLQQSGDPHASAVLNSLMAAAQAKYGSQAGGNMMLGGGWQIPGAANPMVTPPPGRLPNGGTVTR